MTLNNGARIFTSDMNDTFPVCDKHMEKLGSRLGSRVHFYLMDNASVPGYSTLCSGLSLDGGQCKYAATHRAQPG